MSSTRRKPYDTGNALIDSQHREMIRLTNEFKETNHKSHQQLIREFKRLIDFVVFHFAREEELMKEVNYPAVDAKEMIEEHQAFVFYAKLRVVEFSQSKKASAPAIQSFIDSWLESHVFGHDRNLADWISRNKPSASQAA